jgi:hypothetical protein
LLVSIRLRCPLSFFLYDWRENREETFPCISNSCALLFAWRLSRMDSRDNLCRVAVLASLQNHIFSSQQKTREYLARFSSTSNPFSLISIIDELIRDQGRMRYILTRFLLRSVYSDAFLLFTRLTMRIIYTYTFYTQAAVLLRCFVQYIPVYDYITISVSSRIQENLTVRVA